MAQALLVSERILGMSHKDTVFRYMYAGASYADASQVEIITIYCDLDHGYSMKIKSIYQNSAVRNCVFKDFNGYFYVILLILQSYNH